MARRRRKTRKACVRSGRHIVCGTLVKAKTLRRKRKTRRRRRRSR